MGGTGSVGLCSGISVFTGIGDWTVAVITSRLCVTGGASGVLLRWTTITAAAIDAINKTANSHFRNAGILFIISSSFIIYAYLNYDRKL
jgi:hypothetical protein